MGTNMCKWTFIEGYIHLQKHASKEQLTILGRQVHFLRCPCRRRAQQQTKNKKRNRAFTGPMQATNSQAKAAKQGSASTDANQRPRTDGAVCQSIRSTPRITSLVIPWHPNSLADPLLARSA